MTVEEILADLGVTVDPAKAAAVKTWNTKLTASETQSQAQLADATKALAAAQTLNQVINDNIATSGMTETNIAQLRANNAALTAALASYKAAVESIKGQGFTGLTIPELPTPVLDAPPDPVKVLEGKLNMLASNMSAAMRVQTRYYAIFDKPLPIDPDTLVTEAIAARLPVEKYAEQKFNFAGEQATRTAAADQKRIDAASSAAVEKYKADHPLTAGHPDGLVGGGPSNYPNIPAPRKGDTLREFSQKSPMEKIRDARDRVTAEVKSRMAAA